MTDSKPSAVSSPTNVLLAGSYFTIFGLWAVSQYIYIPYTFHLLALVAAILYAACHASLVLRQEDSGDGEAAESVEKETMKMEDAMQFPLVGSLSLFSLYLAFKFLDKDLVNLLLSCYFLAIGCFAITLTFAPMVQQYLLPSKKQYGWTLKVNHPLPEWIGGESPWDLSVQLTASEAVTFASAIAVVGLYYYQSKPWYLNNVLGICFCLQGIERFSLGTYKIGAMLLVGLFFYDIFWVFGTEVMVTVAKSLDGPIKLLLPRSLEPDPETGKMNLSLLGLGDIVIPGFFLSLLLRFDAHQAKQPVHFIDYHASFPKPYFHTALVAYTAGLGLTLFVMFYFKAAQPALLYLVPACLLSSLLTALVRGELTELLAYSEEEEEAEEGKGEEAKKDK